MANCAKKVSGVFDSENLEGSAQAARGDIRNIFAHPQARHSMADLPTRFNPAYNGCVSHMGAVMPDAFPNQFASARVLDAAAAPRQDRKVVPATVDCNLNSRHDAAQSPKRIISQGNPIGRVNRAGSHFGGMGD